MIDTQSYHIKIAVNMQNSYSRITIVTGLWAGQLWSHHSNRDRGGKRIFFRPALWPTQLPIQWAPVVMPREKLERAWSWPLISTMCWGSECAELYHHFAICLRCVHKDNVTFLLWSASFCHYIPICSVLLCNILQFNSFPSLLFVLLLA